MGLDNASTSYFHMLFRRSDITWDKARLVHFLSVFFFSSHLSCPPSFTLCLVHYFLRSQIRKTKSVSVFPVGFAGGLKFEGPICEDGKATSWHASFAPERYRCTLIYTWGKVIMYYNIQSEIRGLVMWYFQMV